MYVYMAPFVVNILHVNRLQIMNISSDGEYIYSHEIHNIPTEKHTTIQNVHISLNFKLLHMENAMTLLHQITFLKIIEPHREKTGFLPMRKQRRRSASR